MTVILRLRILLAMLPLVLVSGCSNLQPVNLPEEQTPPPVSSVFWDGVTADSPIHWHVLLNSGPEALDWRLRAIDSAEAFIDLQTFLWKEDVAGGLVFDHLLKAAERGVRVRVLVDDTFLAGEERLLLAFAAHPNIGYRVFNPFKHRASGTASRMLLNLGDFARLDHRMHNKALVVDNQVGIVGGRNLADEYFGLHGAGNFRDLEVLLGGSVVPEISAAFDAYWNDAWSVPIDQLSAASPAPSRLAAVRDTGMLPAGVHHEEPRPLMQARWREAIAGADTGRAQLYVDRPPEGNPADVAEAPDQVAQELVDLFTSAREEIVIVSAYLIPTPRLEGAVADALARGVRVRILTNSLQSNNHLAAHSAYRNHINTLLASGADLHEVRIDGKGRELYMLAPVERKQLALHAKALIIDHDRVFIGSANLDPRSLRINTEMGFLITSEDFNQRVREAVNADFAADNAWRLELQEDGSVHWLAHDLRLTEQPASSFMQRLEDWLFTFAPIEHEL